ncbi:MAG: general secretion pathway protein GspK [Candidatus Omnitrophica bacterium]|nr:general secretion pathway protein GspK [Candidatus Omnitrophota bacterium]
MLALRRRKAFILISALWTLAFLTTLAVTLLAGIRQKIILFKRLEERSRVQLAAEAGAKKAIAVLLDDLENSQFVLTSKAKQRRMNNPGEFANIDIGDLKIEVVHEGWDEKTGVRAVSWGMADEQGKINLNTATRDVIRRLIVEVLGWGGVEAKGLADAIADWRDYGKHQAEGFFSDDYYKSLEYPYDMKDEPFERIDELLLIKGIDARVYESMLPFVTVYGDGRVNINSASSKVLIALGLDNAVADKVIKFRRGIDNVDATGDDHIFARTFDVAAEVAKGIKLELNEIKQIDLLNEQNLLGTDSVIYSFTSRVISPDGGFKKNLMCVFSAFESRIIYWYEK